MTNATTSHPYEAEQGGNCSKIEGHVKPQGLKAALLPVDNAYVAWETGRSGRIDQSSRSRILVPNPARSISMPCTTAWAASNLLSPVTRPA